MVHHGRVITKTFLTQGTVMTAFGQSNLNGWVSDEVRHFKNQCSSKSSNGASKNQILDSHLTSEVSQNNDTGVRRGI